MGSRTLAALLPGVHTGHGHHAPQVDAASWAVPVLVVLAGCGAYVVGAHALRLRRGRGWSRWRTASWVAGTLLVALAVAPVWAGGAVAARSHAAQHVLLGMLAPVALVQAAPVSLLLGATGTATGRAVTRLLRHPVCHVLSHPVAAAVLAVGSMVVLYTTPLYAASTRHEALHHLLHVHLLAAGCLFAWSVAGPDPAPRRPGTGARVAVLVLASAAHAVLAKQLYARAGDLPPAAGHAVADVQAAAQWMYYGGDVAEVLLAAALLSGWYRRRGRASAGPGCRQERQQVGHLDVGLERVP